MRNATLLSDGDGQTRQQLNEMKVYRKKVTILKEQCINHVAKSVGKGLRNVVHDWRRDGKIRTVKLKMQNGTVLGTVQRIYPLEIQSNETCVVEDRAVEEESGPEGSSDVKTSDNGSWATKSTYQKKSQGLELNSISYANPSVVIFGKAFFYTWKDIPLWTDSSNYKSTTNTVMILLEDLLDKGYCVTLDNFYTSP
ncbi:unnamed protein product [Larinioides sclopetarius]|uniref:Mutator-like transposase domain-containing protein n=1 Tax=Larinioides sclopetarius TaxID=280406 RepID=A0AAV1Z1K5_9ARAC